MSLSLSAPQQHSTSNRIRHTPSHLTSGDQEELAAGAEGDVHGRKADEIIPKLVQVDCPGLPAKVGH